MSIQQRYAAPADPVPEFALAHLRRWAHDTPAHIALRQRRHGAWHAWRWGDVLAEVERCAAGLAAQGFSGQTPVALCGALEPTLLIVALAVRSLGGACVVVSRQHRGERLQAELQQWRPGFAWVQRREDVDHWRRASRALSLPVKVVCGQAAATAEGQWQVVPLATLLPATLARPQAATWAPGAGGSLVWVDEGTEWHEGLQQLLSRWLRKGEGFAFPEAPEAAQRDRIDAGPAALLLSAARAQALADELDARLAPPGTWRRRLCDWAQVGPERGLRRWLRVRMRRLQGFQHLAEVDCPAHASDAAPGHQRLAWLRPARSLRRAA